MRITALHHRQRTAGQRLCIQKGLAPAIKGTIEDRLAPSGRQQYLLPEPGEVHIPAGDLRPVLRTGGNGQIEIVHMHHVAGKEPLQQSAETALAAAAAPIHRHYDAAFFRQLPVKCQQRRKVMGVVRRQNAIVGMIGLSERLTVVDCRAACGPVIRQPVPHTGDRAALQQIQSLCQLRRRAGMLPGRPAKQLSQQLPRRGIPRPRQVQPAKPVSDRLRPEHTVRIRTQRFPLLLQQPVNRLGIFHQMLRSEHMLIGQLAVILGHHGRIAGGMCLQNRFKAVLHGNAPSGCVPNFHDREHYTEKCNFLQPRTSKNLTAPAAPACLPTRHPHPVPAVRPACPAWFPVG